MVIDELGPGHFRVLPDDLTSTLEAGGPEAIRGQITEAIRQRQIDYAELIGKIDDGDVGYEHFGPVISSLLPLADPGQVNARITDEMDSHHFWSLVEAVIVGIATVFTLLLTIFPPTSAFGIAALTGLETGLAAYGVYKAPEMITVGAAYSLGQGADDVFSRQQQDAGAMMVLGGVVSLLTGPLAILRSATRPGQLAEERHRPRPWRPPAPRQPDSLFRPGGRRSGHRGRGGIDGHPRQRAIPTSSSWCAVTPATPIPGHGRRWSSCHRQRNGSTAGCPCRTARRTPYARRRRDATWRATHRVQRLTGCAWWASP